jgi:hypothetical protein
MAAAAGGVGAIGAPTGVATPLSTIATFMWETATGVAAITVAAIVRDTPRTGPALRATAPAILAMVAHQHTPAIVRLIVLRLQLFLQIRAIARMPQTIPVRGRAGGRRVLCRPIQGIVRTRPRVHDPARMKRAVISVHRPQIPALPKPIVRMHFPDRAEGVRRAREGTKVWQPRVAGEVARGAKSP